MSSGIIARREGLNCFDEFDIIILDGCLAMGILRVRVIHHKEELNVTFTGGIFIRRFSYRLNLSFSCHSIYN
jgi:hypothetical protein